MANHNQRDTKRNAHNIRIKFIAKSKLQKLELRRGFKTGYICLHPLGPHVTTQVTLPVADSVSNFFIKDINAKLYNFHLS